EVVEILFDMGTFGDDEPHLAKDRDDLVDGLTDRVDAPGVTGQYRQCDIGALAGETLGARGAAEPFARLGKGRRNLILRGIQCGASLAPRLGRERAEAAHQPGQPSAPAEGADPDCPQSSGPAGLA